MDKAQLRRLLRQWLRTLSAGQRDLRSRRACHEMLAFEPFQKASVVMLFLSMPDEIDTTTAIHAAWDLGKTVVVPKVDWDHRTMTPVVLTSFDHLEVEHGGLRNPTGGHGVDMERIDLVVTPGLGFDRQGHRLGRGSGFYDRFLADPRLWAGRCGLCYADQIVDVIPVTEKDQPVDWVVTDEQVLYIQDQKGV